MSYFVTGGPEHRNTELTGRHQSEECGKGQKEMPRVHSPSRILAGIHLG